jgi:hypothetical protein
MLDLSRPCDACGKPIGGGLKRCPKCQIYFRYLCRVELMSVKANYHQSVLCAVVNLCILEADTTNGSGLFLREISQTALLPFLVLNKAIKK